jgi:hypothetical protein
VGIDAGPFDDRTLDHREEVGGVHARETAVAPTDRGPDRLHDDDVAHLDVLLVW